MREELEDIVGFTKTHWICDCGEENEEEGDVTGEVVECSQCGSRYCCERVM